MLATTRISICTTTPECPERVRTPNGLGDIDSCKHTTPEYNDVPFLDIHWGKKEAKGKKVCSTKKNERNQLNTMSLLCPPHTAINLTY